MSLGHSMTTLSQMSLTSMAEACGNICLYGLLPTLSPGRRSSRDPFRSWPAGIMKPSWVLHSRWENAEPQAWENSGTARENQIRPGTGFPPGLTAA